ncbi:MAG: TSUP family transporter, partial [Oscillospiraceae bacterium]
MSPLRGLLLLAAGFTGSVVQSTCGFGLGIVMMTVLPYLLPSYAQATALSSICSLAQASLVAWQDRVYLRWRIVLPPLLANVCASTAMILFAAGQSDEQLTRALGALLILLSLYFFFFNDRIQI